MKAVQQFIMIFSLLCQVNLLLAQPKAIMVSSATETNFLENRYALIIGNDHYIDPNISTLASCRLDAERMASFLRSPKGFALPPKQMKVLLDANRSELIQQFTNLLNSIEHPESSTFYFYYSGHGLKGSIVPTDYNSGAPETALSYSWIKTELEKRRIKAKVFIIDACYAGSALQTKDLDESPASFADAILENSAEDNFIMYTATNAYRVTPAGKHESLYTKYVLKALRSEQSDTDKNGTLDSGELAYQLEKQLGSSNSPQFSGGTNFPMALFGRNNDLNQLASTQVNVRTSGLDDIVLWRQRLNERENDVAKISEMISKLEALNSAEARARVGYLYREGIGVTKDYQKAITYFIPSALKGNSFALYNLGYLYAQGFGVSKNIIKAIEYYEKAAAQGDAFAQHNLGCIYKLGDTQLVKVDLKKAISWYTQSYENGLAEAAFELAKLYQKENNMKLAVYWYEEAATMELPSAQYELAFCYQEGIALEQDTEAATFWYNRACVNGNLRACSAIMQTEL